MKKLIGVFGATLLLAGPLTGVSVAQDSQIEGRGDIQGRVVATSTGGPLASVQVLLEGTTMSARTDLNGRYVINNIPQGTYRVIVRNIGFTAKTVTNVVVETDEITSLDVTLDRSVFQLAAIEVTAEAERGTAVSLIENRRAASVVTNSIGDEEISRSAASDAAGALRQVSGLSIVDSRYVVVRGLSDRYSSATLNGAPLPSTEPDRKAVPLDLFPSNLLEAVTTTKTYSPDQPGDHSGGLVNIATTDFPGQRTIRFSLGTGYNSNTTLQDGLSYRGGGTDYLGVDDGTRGLPGRVPGDVKVVDALVGDLDLRDIGRSFSSTWRPTMGTTPLNSSMSLSIADATTLFGSNVGFLAAGTYSNSYSTENLVERVIVTASANELPETDYSGMQTERTVRWSLFGKGNILLSPSNQLTVRSLFSRTGEDQSRNLIGFNRDRNTVLDNTRLRFISRSMWSNNLEGEHLLTGLGDARINWRVGFSRATSDEPDRREVVYEEEANGQFAWRELTNSGLRYFTALEDTDRNAALDLTLPLGEFGSYVVKIGGMALNKERDFFTRRFRFRARGGIGSERFLPADELFSPENIRPDFLELEEDTRRTDNYDGSQITRAAYAMLEAPIGPFRISGGARLEQVRQVVNPVDLFALGLPALDSAYIDNADLLPGVNLTWSPSDLHNVRFAFSRTVARPQFREQAPFDFVDFAGGYLQVGNPALQRSSVFNYDLRWEWFPETGSLFAISGFYKSFDDPIEAVVFPSSELISTWDNNESADVYGAEFELRSSLAGLGEPLANFALGGNLSLIHSSVTSKDSLQLTGGATIAIEPRERALQGQSPYVVNLSLAYLSPGGGTSITALFNRFGRRIDKVGTQVLPDVFENPVNQLDLVIRHDLGFAGMKFSATNLLDSDVSFEQANQVVRRASRGRSVSVGFSIGSSN